MRVLGTKAAAGEAETAFLMTEGRTGLRIAKWPLSLFKLCSLVSIRSEKKPGSSNGRSRIFWTSGDSPEDCSHDDLHIDMVEAIDRVTESATLVQDGGDIL